MTLELATAFEGHSIRVLRWRGRLVWIASEVARAMGYANPKKLTEKIAGAWAEDFIDRVDFEVLRGEELRAWHDAVPESGTASKASHLTLLFESGLHMALLKARVAKSIALRRFLVTEVLPKLARGEAIPAARGSATGAELERLPEGRAALRVEVELNTVQQLEAAARRTGLRPVDTARWVLRAWACTRFAEYGLTEQPDLLADLRELQELRRAAVEPRETEPAPGGAPRPRPFR